MIRLKKKIIVAIDGYSSCGKSSFAKLIARNLGYLYLDSGAMYRAVALHALHNNAINDQKVIKSHLLKILGDIRISFRIVENENHTFLNGEDVEKKIRGVEVSSVVSFISKIPEIRQRLVRLQQQMGRERGIVMDGRDIGTIVFPDAEIKIFMTARIEVRARRRYDELKTKRIEAGMEEIKNNITDRDHQDMHRKVSPLRQAEDAVVLDNSDMTFDEQMEWFLELLRKRSLLA
jgi:cytidylate kinase